MNPLKKEVLDCLIREQGQLCVYCMCRIPRDDKEIGIADPTIEHFIPLEYREDKGQGLDYKNLFAVCHGNQKAHTKGQRHNSSTEGLTCDKHRGNTGFKKINPCVKETLQSIYYDAITGEIKATDPEVEYDLINTLNLNCLLSPVVSERKEALNALVNDMAGEKTDDLLEYCRYRLEVFENEVDIKTPYVGIIIWYLRDMIRALER